MADEQPIKSVRVEYIDEDGFSHIMKIELPVEHGGSDRNLLVVQLIQEIKEDSNIKFKPSSSDLIVYHIDPTFNEKMQVPVSFNIPNMCRSITVEIKEIPGEIFL